MPLSGFPNINKMQVEMIIFYPEQSTWLSSLPMKLRMANFPLLKLQGTWDQTGFYKPEGL